MMMMYSYSDAEAVRQAEATAAKSEAVELKECIHMRKVAVTWRRGDVAWCREATKEFCSM